MGHPKCISAIYIVSSVGNSLVLEITMALLVSSYKTLSYCHETIKTCDCIWWDIKNVFTSEILSTVLTGFLSGTELTTSKATVPLTQIFSWLFTIETIEQSRTIFNCSAQYSFLSKRNRNHPYNILNYLHISRKLFSFCLINPQLSYFDRKVSVKCSEKVEWIFI